MSLRSFPSRSRKRPLRVWPGKLVCLLALLILAGCGGSPQTKLQTVRGSGFHFQAPIGWPVVQVKLLVEARHGKVDLMEVLRYKLVKPYRVELFAGVSRELDRVTDGLAKQLSGRVTSRATVRLAGRKARSYRIDYGAGKTQEIGFVLEGQSEYELLCRRPAKQSDATCQAFFASFTLT